MSEKSFKTLVIKTGRGQFKEILPKDKQWGDKVVRIYDNDKEKLERRPIEIGGR